MEKMSYNKLKSYVKDCPNTWVGALLIELMERSAIIPVFQSGGLVKLAQKVEDKYQNTDKKELVTIREAESVNPDDQQKQYRIRNARVLKEIKNTLVGKGYDVEYMDIEKLPDIIHNGMVDVSSYLKPKPCPVNHEAHSDKDAPCYVCGELLNPDF